MIVSIGDELLLGKATDTNAGWLSQQLGHLGINVAEHLTLGDNLEAISDHLKQVGAVYEIIIASGGLGPTDDDLTRHALARVLGTELRLHEESLRCIEGFFTRLGRDMVDRNRIQAMIPDGCVTMNNAIGTAPGIVAKFGKAQAFFLPGVPREMKQMFNEAVAPTLADTAQKGKGRQVFVSRTLHTFGIGESNVAELLGDLMERGRNPTVNSTVSKGIVSLHIHASAANTQAGVALIEPVAQQLRSLLGSLVFGEDEDTLAGVVGRVLCERGLTLAAAESCTGGLLAKEITDAPGASRCFRCGWVCYSNQAKVSALEVDTDIIGREGAVSEPVARLLAKNARHLAGSDYGIGITGIAGPGGGTPEKPVGLVYISLAGRGFCVAHRMLFHGDRAMVRQRAVHSALDLLRQRLLGQ